MSVSDAPVRRPTTSLQVIAFDGHDAHRRPDQLVTEEPLEIRVHGPRQEPEPLVVTMRTPGNDFELAVGFCLSEGIMRSPEELDSIAYCLGGDGEQLYNVVTVKLRAPVESAFRERHFLANSSCGICGKAALEDIEVRCEAVTPGPSIAAEAISRLPRALAEHQRVFGATGGLHAAARFTADGSFVAAREDVGRHNALDKLVGHAFLDRALPLENEILLVSGRVSFELVQKAAVAGFPILCAVSAPSSLAVGAAERFGQTIVGFVRDDRFNVYTNPERIEF